MRRKRRKFRTTIPSKGNRVRSNLSPSEKDRVHILEQFKASDLPAWRKFSRTANAYHVELFHFLESQRKIYESKILEALRSSSIGEYSANNCWRIVTYKYSNAPISPQGSLFESGRFNIGIDVDPDKFPIFPALYVAESEQLATIEKFGSRKSDGISRETLALGSKHAMPSKPSYSAVRVEMKLGSVLDLTKRGCLTDFVSIVSKFKVPQNIRTLGAELKKKPPWIISDEKSLVDTLIDQDWAQTHLQKKNSI